MTRQDDELITLIDGRIRLHEERKKKWLKPLLQRAMRLLKGLVSLGEEILSQEDNPNG